MKHLSALLLLWLVTTNAFASHVNLMPLVRAINAVNQYQLMQELPQLQSINDLLKSQIGDQITGNYGIGDYHWDPKSQSWGDKTGSWDDVLKIYQQGGNPGDLGSVAKTLAKQFPIQNLATLKNFNPQETNKAYYDVQAKTALAARAASQLTFDRIQKEIELEQALQEKIDHTTNIKESMDLQNRLQVENNLIQLELLRLAALSNQQQAISSQAEVNATVTNASLFKANP